MEIRLAKNVDAENIKNMINEMYGLEYEIRKLYEIQKAIEMKSEIYIIAEQEGSLIGFSGASIKTGRCVIDYIYVKDNHRGLLVAYELIMRLLKELVAVGIKSAELQVQTFNKQRFFHYALANKNIISSIYCSIDGREYYDQVLLIENLKNVSEMSAKELMAKAVKFKQEELKKQLV